ncbi:hypothetical protein [Actinocorallia populi]|uniref:hypothetical protein n=1 Tax=Actinocorallia populi TaxID=2079200 RepID=UPI000D08A5AB|nr:hypothetical protein [Actinocorallia populi]
MRFIRPARTGRALTAVRVAAASAACAVTALSLTVTPAAAQPAAAPGQACTAADLGKRHPIIKSTEVAPTITHFKGWYVTQGTAGYQNVTTSTQTTISVSVGLDGEIGGEFAVELLGTVGATLGLNVQVNYSSTSSESTSVSWDFYEPGYYGVYKGTKKVTGTYGSLNCNRVQQGDGSWALKWIEGPDSGSFTTYTTLEEGAVRCQDTVSPTSIMAKAQSLLDCGSAAAQAEHPAGAVEPTAKQLQDRSAQPSGTSTEKPKATGSSARAALSCSADAYKIAVPGKPLSWGAPLLQNDGVRLRPSTFFSAHLDHWRLCNVAENNGVLEATLWNWGSGWCAAVPPQTAADERAILMTASCAEDDLQRFYIYRDVPGSDKIGVQNKYTGSMMGYDRYADGEHLRQYSSGRQDGSGTFSQIKV